MLGVPLGNSGFQTYDNHQLKRTELIDKLREFFQENKGLENTTNFDNRIKAVLTYQYLYIITKQQIFCSFLNCSHSWTL